MNFGQVDDAPLKNNMERKKIWPVCLPEINQEYFEEKTFVAGWGITKTKNIHVSTKNPDQPCTLAIVEYILFYAP